MPGVTGPGNEEVVGPSPFLFFSTRPLVLMLLPGGASHGKPSRSQRCYLQPNMVYPGAQALQETAGVWCLGSWQDIRSFRAPDCLLQQQAPGKHSAHTGQPGETWIPLIPMPLAHLFKGLWFSACSPQH